MKKSNLFKVAGLGVAALSILAAPLSVSVANADTVLTVSSWASPQHAMNASVFPWMDGELKACSGGSLGLKVEYGLASPLAQYDTVRDGVADINWMVHGYTPGKFETTKLAELPGLYGKSETVSAAFQATWEKYLAAANEAKGVEILANFVHGPGMIHTVKPISSFKDLKGMKLRVGGGVANDIGRALGVAGVNMPAPNVYEALSSGVAEGVFFPMETMHAFKVSEVVKNTYRNTDGIYTTSFAIAMNKDTYDGLSASHRKCIDDMRGVKMAAKVGSYWDAADDLGMAEGLKVGLSVTDASDSDKAYFKELTAGIEAKVLAAIDGRGVDGKAALAFFKSQL
ncbi:TRAP transporter substrate-binding protein [Candidatus Puniceispirillum sp.]|uniref:TRAP transporter substrate-binding protein n=1 Tax=Candidatus Puniceispirillum sp. TaxID=2026719 RepID=UPI003F6A4E56